MFKTGVTTRTDLIAGKDKTLIRKDDKHVSISLYDHILHDSKADALAERILLLFADERGAYKRTYSRRFEAFDQEALKIIQQRFSSLNSLIVHDVGVSDARTSVDFFQSAVKLFPNMILYASDLNPKITIIEKGNISIALSSTDKVLQIIWPPFVFNALKRDSYRHYPLNQLIRKGIEWLVLPSIMRAYHSGTIRSKELFLYCPAALQLSKSTSQFQLLQHNLLDPLPYESHIVRAMNVLNCSYFTEEQMSNIVNNIFNNLSIGGLFITGSNQDAGTLIHGGIYEKTPVGFIKLWQSGEGSPIEAKILKVVRS